MVVIDGYTINPGDNPWTGLEALGKVDIFERSSSGQVVSRSQGAEILIVNKVQLTREIIEQLPDLNFVAVTATGYDNVDIAAAKERGIPVCNIPVYGTDTVSQFVFAHILDHCHHVALHAEAVAAGEWSRCADFSFWKTPQIELAGKCLGIVGFGKIGRRVGEIGQAFGMEIIAFDVFRGEEPDYSKFRWIELEELFVQSDFITLHCNLTKDNAEFVNKSLLEKVKPEAFFINAARGPLVNEADLAEALNSSKLSGAALDVVSVEPIKENNPLLRAKNCTITPHIAWSTLEARKRMVEMTVKNISGFLEGRPVNIVN